MMAYGIPDPQGIHHTEYWDGFVDAISDFVQDRRACGWFGDKDDMLGYYGDKWSEKQQFAAGFLWELADLE